MGDLLGDDHDLAALRQLLTADTGRFSDGDDLKLLLDLIDSRRAELEREAKLMGGRFFQDSPRVFVRRLKAYWRTWREQVKSEQPEEAAQSTASSG